MSAQIGIIGGPSSGDMFREPADRSASCRRARRRPSKRRTCSNSRSRSRSTRRRRSSGCASRRSSRRRGSRCCAYKKRRYCCPGKRRYKSKRRCPNPGRINICNRNWVRISIHPFINFLRCFRKRVPKDTPPSLMASKGRCVWKKMSKKRRQPYIEQARRARCRGYRT